MCETFDLLGFFYCLATKRLRPYPLSLRIVQLLTDPCLQILIYHRLLSLHTEVAVQKDTGVEERQLYEGVDYFFVHKFTAQLLHCT